MRESIKYGKKSGLYTDSISKRKSRSKKSINKKCKKDEILNPKTNRCVKISGKIGKDILKNKSKLKSKKTKSTRCKKDEIRNPKTNRCVKRSGKIGKKLEQSKTKVISKHSTFNKPQIYYAGYKVLYKGLPATITARYYGNNEVINTYEIMMDKNGKIYDFVHYNDLELI
jgi:hypothetical protein